MSKYSVEEFAKIVKNKYPEYNDVENLELVTNIIDKYAKRLHTPEYFLLLLEAFLLSLDGIVFLKISFFFPSAYKPEAEKFLNGKSIPPFGLVGFQG